MVVVFVTNGGCNVRRETSLFNIVYEYGLNFLSRWNCQSLINSQGNLYKFSKYIIVTHKFFDTLFSRYFTCAQLVTLLVHRHPLDILRFFLEIFIERKTTSFQEVVALSLSYSLPLSTTLDLVPSSCIFVHSSSHHANAISRARETACRPEKNPKRNESEPSNGKFSFINRW